MAGRLWMGTSILSAVGSLVMLALLDQTDGAPPPPLPSPLKLTAPLPGDKPESAPGVSRPAATTNTTEPEKPALADTSAKKTAVAPNSEKAEKSEKPTHDDPVLGEIAKLRQSLGGLPGGTTSGNEAEFLEALKKIAEHSPPPRVGPTREQIIPSLDSPPLERLPRSDDVSPPRFERSFVDPMEGSSVDILIEETRNTLRGSARTLEQLAADFEDNGRYPDADKLRKLAQRLRVQAREFDSPQAP